MVAATAVAAVGVAVSAASAYSSAKAGAAAQRSAESQAAQSLAFQKEQQAKLDAQKEEYKKFKFENPYEDMENVMEDLTVDTRAAEFQAQQGAQQRSNIMQNLRGAASGSGIAALAQSLANQGQLQAQQISANIGQQERQNQIMAAQQASTIDMAERGGEAMVQEAEMARQATLLGVEYGGAAGANQALQAAQANQMAATTAANQMRADAMSTVASGIQSFAGNKKAMAGLEGMFNGSGD